MEISLLGPLRVEHESEEITFSAAKERSLLRVLALQPSRVVSTDALICALWGDQPPQAARKTLQTYIWNLRRVLGESTIETRPPGYRLAVEPQQVDVVNFRALIGKGEAALRAGDHETASSHLGAAVALWRGDPCIDVAPHTGLANEGVRLTEEYLTALESRLAADLALGRHHQLVSEVEALVADNPYRERLWAHLIVARYRCGQQAAALAAFQRVRAMLAEELGLEPGGELRRLELAVLDQDPGLDAPVPAPLASDVGMIPTPVRYVTCADGVAIAYQVMGSGPIDILAVPGFMSHLDIWWNAPTDRLVCALASMGRLICFDKRGMGMSDRPEHIRAEQWIDDAVAVLDAVGSSSAVVLGVSGGVPTAIQLAHRHPSRVERLALYGGYARLLAAQDYEIGLDRSVVESFVEVLIDEWGSGVGIDAYAPARAEEPGVRDYWARYQQLSASPPAAMRFLAAAIDVDVRELLPEIDVPSLVVHAERDVVVPVAMARYMADRLPGARLVTLDSDIHLMCVSDVVDEIIAEIGAFLRRPEMAPTPM
jgi:DNA-binding SARP family transcriptional activator/pimeloyl-ACP methyl ester carboxylesterase